MHCSVILVIIAVTVTCTNVRQDTAWNYRLLINYKLSADLEEHRCMQVLDRHHPNSNANYHRHNAWCRREIRETESWGRVDNCQSLACCCVSMTIDYKTEFHERVQQTAITLLVDKHSVNFHQCLVDRPVFKVKKSKVNMDLYSALCVFASNALPLPISWHWSPLASPSARQSVNTARPGIQAGVSRDMPVYSPNLRRVLI